jgi:hypothetical protein
MTTKQEVTRVRFISTVSKMKDRRYINIPKNYITDVEKLGDRQVRVTLDDEF